MPRDWMRLVLPGLLVFVVVLVLQLPAGWVFYWMDDRVAQGLEWQQASGSVFNAHIRQAGVIFPGERIIRLHDIELQTSVLPLLLGRVVTEFRARSFSGDEFSGRLDSGWGRWRLKQIEGSLSLQELSALLPELELFGIHGRILFRGTDIAGNYNDLPDTGSLDSMLEDLQLALIETPGSLGSYAIQLDGNGEGLLAGTVQTANDNALLILDLSLRVEADNNTMLLEGRARAGNNAPDVVRDILPLLGTVENGEVRINWQRRL